MASAAVPSYFSYSLQLHGSAALRFGVDAYTAMSDMPASVFYRTLAHGMQAEGSDGSQVSAARLGVVATLFELYRHMMSHASDQGLHRRMAALERLIGSKRLQNLEARFISEFPALASFHAAAPALKKQSLFMELVIWLVARNNRALLPFSSLFVAELPLDHDLPEGLEVLKACGDIALDSFSSTLFEALTAPLSAEPDSLEGQVAYIRSRWGSVLPDHLFEMVAWAFDRLREEEAMRGGDGGGQGAGQPVLHFSTHHEDPDHLAGYEQHEYEAFTTDADWMPNVVMVAKMTHVWLTQLSARFGYPIERLDQIPDQVLDELASCGFTTLWLIGLWERSYASARIKQLCGNPEAHASAYAIEDYRVADDLGGEVAFQSLKGRAWQRGIRLASDMVPNHTGITSRWVREHPDWFIQSDYLPFPTYRFSGDDLSDDPAITIQLEDGYWDRCDAAVVFRHHEHASGRVRYIYHGNDGTSIPWNDTAQLNYLLPAVREAVIQTIIAVARRTPVIRFDAAMILAKKHYQRLWFPQRGLGGGIPSRSDYAMGREAFDAAFPVEFWREVVDRMAVESPDTLLLAEAFWLMEGYFVRTLGMHRVYNSAFMNMLRHEENAQYRETIANVLAFNPQILQRFVNFMNNPDEKTAAEQFGTQDKYFGVCVLLATMPGLPMFGHGQVEGFREKYGMEYRRAYWDEPVDDGLVRGHRQWIFPLLKRRSLFSGAERFTLYTPRAADGSIVEDVFAYSNGRGDQRALVLYHNRHSTTAVQIKEAVPIATEDGSLLVRQLADELLVEEQHDTAYLRLYDLMADVWYLRSCRTIREEGLHSLLGPYQSQVFLHIGVVQASPEEPWDQLCHLLNGAGVPSLDEALAEVRHATLIERFATLLDMMGSETSRSCLSRALRQVMAELPLLVTPAVATRHVRLGVTRFFAFEALPLRRILRTLRRCGIDRLLLPCSQQSVQTARMLLLMEGLLALLPAGSLTSLGLARRMVTFVAGQRIERGDTSLTADMMQAVAVACRHCREQRQGSLVPALLRDPRLTAFLMIHTDQGITWFNKERFELLVAWMVLRGLIAAWQGERVNIPDFCFSVELARQAGYRVERTIAFAETGLAAEAYASASR